MHDGLAAPTSDGDNPVRRDSPAPTPAPRSPEEPTGRSGSGSREAPNDTTDAPTTMPSSEDGPWRLTDRAQELWEQTLPLRKWLAAHWDRLLATLQDTAPISAADPTASAAPAAPGPLIERLDTPMPIRVSGQGRRFNFHIHARCFWSAEQVPREVLLSTAHYCMTYAIRRLTQLAAEHAVNFAVYQAAELESELQQALSATGPWRYRRGDTVVTCQPHIWVDVDEQVRKVVLPYRDELLKLDCEFEVDRTKAAYADQLGQPRATSAASAADGTAAGETTAASGADLAGELRPLVAELRATAQRLEDLLGRTPDGDTD
ncbi:hypothetical protein GCM10023176_44820 [Micromonospora coerulea]|uniref:Uncharacterized protein n=1 Tax=Micromonospora coerulea TaxID=47856 RepID=A0ABP8SV53_9ACTN